MVSNMFYFHPYLGKIPILTNIFQMGWNHQLVIVFWVQRPWKVSRDEDFIKISNGLFFLMDGGRLPRIHCTFTPSKNPDPSEQDFHLPKIHLGISVLVCGGVPLLHCNLKETMNLGFMCPVSGGLKTSIGMTDFTTHPKLLIHDMVG